MVEGTQYKFFLYECFLYFLSYLTIWFFFLGFFFFIKRKSVSILFDISLYPFTLAFVYLFIYFI